jgi:hypothetical protein
VSFVYLHAGTPFAKKGDMQMTLPKMDVPVNVLEWELFMPDRYRVDRFDGNMLTADLFEHAVPTVTYGSGSGMGTGNGVGVAGRPPMTAMAGQIVGRIVDPSGAPIPGATVIVEGGGRRQQVVTDGSGAYALSAVPSGPLVVQAQMSGFATVSRSLVFDQRPRQLDMAMSLGGVSETVTVAAEAPVIDTRSAETNMTIRMDEGRYAAQASAQAKARQAETEPSANVQSLQRRASGVLPVRMEVPRAGTSHRFLKPLVIDEATVVSFRYKRR